MWKRTETFRFAVDGRQLPSLKRKIKMGEIVPIREDAKLICLADACRALAAAKQIETVIDVRDKAQAVAHYLRQHGDSKDAMLDAAELKLRAERRLAKQLSQTGKQAVPVNGNGCTVEDLHQLVAEGKRFGCIYADPPWKYDNQATRASTDNHYQTMTVEEICDNSSVGGTVRNRNRSDT